MKLFFWLALLLLQSCLTPPQSSHQESNTPYFPLELGRYWRFQRTLPNQKMKIIYGISGYAGSVYQVFIETDNGSKEIASIHVRNGSLFLVRAVETNREEACLLEKDLTEKQSWKWRDGTATVLAEETISVPAGTFKAIPVEYKRQALVDKEGKTKHTSETIWFAKEVGWVKIEQKIEGVLVASNELLQYGVTEVQRQEEDDTE